MATGGTAGSQGHRVEGLGTELPSCTCAVALSAPPERRWEGLRLRTRRAVLRLSSRLAVLLQSAPLAGLPGRCPRETSLVFPSPAPHSV